MSDGSEHVLDTSQPEQWSVSAGPVSWDHFFRKSISSTLSVSFPATSTDVTCRADGETYNGHVDIAKPPAGQPARLGPLRVPRLCHSPNCSHSGIDLVSLSHTVS